MYALTVYILLFVKVVKDPKDNNKIINPTYNSRIGLSLNPKSFFSYTILLYFLTQIFHIIAIVIQDIPITKRFIASMLLTTVMIGLSPVNKNPTNP